jgi:hypothetical protein
VAAAGLSALAGKRPALGADQADKGPPRPFVGIQIAAHSFLDEGIDHCLDLLKGTAGINALLISTHAYYGAMGRPKEVMADHGVPIRDNKSRKLRKLWVKHHPKNFSDTTLRHPAPDPTLEYADRDVLTELAGPARQRGMKLYVRWYQVGASAKPEIQNLEKVLTVDMNGKPGHKPCWFNPDYRAWLVATMTDLFENYPLDGLQYGPERQDPITEMYVWGAVPNCFCPHCLQRARKKRIDADRARQGFAKLFEFIKGLRRGQVNPADGVFVSLLRILLKNPEILLWNYQYFEGSEEVHRLVYETVKAIRPEIQVGRHVDHIQSSTSVTYRASLSYAEMAQYADFIKPILYHDIFGPRLKKWHVDALGRTFLKDFSPEQSLELYYALFGLDPKTEPKLEELDQRGFSPEYVYRETKRCVDGVEGNIPVYPGIGLDVPKGGNWGTQRWPSDPETVYHATRRAFDAGASGVVASREYEEIGIPSLNAVGRAVRERFAG